MFADSSFQFSTKLKNMGRPALVLLIVVAGFQLLTSCREIVVYPDEPVVEFKEISIRDTTDVLDNPVKLVTITFQLIDGNGDVGLDSTQIEGPFDPDSAFHFNLIINEYHPVNGSLVPVPLPGGLKKYRIPDLTPSGQNKTLKADVSVKIEYPYSQAQPLPHSELQYLFYVYDRALNPSNRDTTDPVIFF